MANYQQSASVPLAPYVPTYDTDQYAKVIQYKQGQYDTNVSRIQSSLDKASQLEILNPYQKQYMDQKLQETTTELNRVAGSDFSQNAITNTAMGIAGTIYKDPVIQSGVMSTQQIKSQYADRKRLEKAGLYNDVTKFHDDREVSRYVQSTDINDYYKGSTTASKVFDLKKIEDAIIAKNPDVEVQIGNYGQIERFTDKSKSRTPDQIANIVRTELQNQPDALKYIGMVGQYNYQGLDQTQFLKTIDSQIGSISGSYDNLINKLEQNTLLNKTNSLTNATIIAQLKAKKEQYTGYDKDGVHVPGYYTKLREMVASGDLDGAKSVLQQENFVTNAIQKYTVNDHDISLDVPEVVKFQYQKAENQRNYDLQVARLKEEIKQNTWKRAVDEATLGIKLGKDGQVIVASTNAPEEGSYNSAKHEQKIQELAAAEQMAEADLRKQWVKTSSNNPAFKTWTNDQKEIEFRVYKKINEDMVANNQPENVDVDYLVWRNQHEGVIQKKKYFDEVKNTLTSEANEKYPVQGQLNFPDLGLSLPLNSPVTNIIKQISDKVEATAQLVNSQNPGKEGDRTAQYRNLYGPPIVTQEIEKYRNNPTVYNALKAASAKGFSRWNDVAGSVNSQLGQIQSLRSKDINENFKSYGPHLNDKNLVITNKDRKAELLQVVTGMSSEALSQAGVEIDSKNSENLGLDIKSVGRDNVSGEFYANIVDAKGNPRKIIVPLVNAERYIPTNPYNYIDEQLASRGHTSYDPSSALSTSNAKLSYVIDTDVKGRYVSIIGPGGTPIRTDFRNNDASTIAQTMDYVAKAINPNTGKGYSREEIIGLLNNPTVSQQIIINAK